MYNIDSIRDRLEGLGFPRGGAIHDSLVAVAVVLGESNLTKDQIDIVLDLMSTEGREEANDLGVYGDDAWEDFSYGNVRIGDIVRLKKDAYDSEIGSLHNGRVGRLTYMSNRICTVSYIGIPTEKTMKHNMNKLQSLVRGVG